MSGLLCTQSGSWGPPALSPDGGLRQPLQKGWDRPAAVDPYGGWVGQERGPAQVHRIRVVGSGVPATTPRTVGSGKRPVADAGEAGAGGAGWSGRRRGAAGAGARRRGSLPGSGLGSRCKTGWTSGTRSTSSSSPGATPRAQPRAAAATAVIPAAHPHGAAGRAARSRAAPPSAPGASSAAPPGGGGAIPRPHPPSGPGQGAGRSPGARPPPAPSGDEGQWESGEGAGANGRAGRGGALRPLP